MKKNLLYALALATSMVACTDDYTDWGTPQQNDPEAIKSASLTVTAAETIDFATLTDDDEYVTIFTSPAATADEGAKVVTMIVPTNEELAIARETVRLV